MKKKILSLTLVVCLLAIAVVGGTLAYFKDADSAKNTMTMGKVNIVQNERLTDGSDYVDGLPLMPAIYPEGINEGNILGRDGYFVAGIENLMDKVVTVTNEAPQGASNQDAYVRTIIAFETNTIYQPGTDVPYGEKNGDAHWGYINVAGDFDYIYLDEEKTQFATITLNGVKYVLAVKVYEDPLVAGETTTPSLKQVFMTPDAGNEIADLFGDEYTILTLSQATQVQGFGDAETALNTAFGDVATYAQTWFTELGY